MNDKKQRKLLNCLKESGIYFIPFTVDGNWDYADNIRVIDIDELTDALKKYSEWNYEISMCKLNYSVYILDITINNESLKKEILHPFQKFKGHYWDINIKSCISLYLRYSDMYMLYKRRSITRKDWLLIKI